MNKENARDYLPLVQALAEGKVIQGVMVASGEWEDMREVNFASPSYQYRIKPEPREIWLIDYPDGSQHGPFLSGYEAATHNRLGGKISIYREVIQ